MVNSTSYSWTTEEQAEHRRQWVQALRSGDYEQTGGGLTRVPDTDNEPTNNKYCCLGVACEISELGNWMNGDGHYDKSRYYIVNEDSSAFELPDAVREWLGLDTAIGTLYNLTPPTVPKSLVNTVLSHVTDNHHNLADINDYGLDFNSIADIIEYAEDFGMLANR